MKQKRTTPANGITRRQMMVDLFADAKVDFIINKSGTLTMIVDDRADVDFARKDGTDSFAAVGGGTYLAEENVSRQSTPELLAVLKQFAEDASGTRRYVNLDGWDNERLVLDAVEGAPVFTGPCVTPKYATEAFRT